MTASDVCAAISERPVSEKAEAAGEGDGEIAFESTPVGKSMFFKSLYVGHPERIDANKICIIRPMVAGTRRAADWDPGISSCLNT
jgi:hypothetical protein